MTKLVVTLGLILIGMLNAQEKTAISQCANQKDDLCLECNKGFTLSENLCVALQAQSNSGSEKTYCARNRYNESVICGTCTWDRFETYNCEGIPKCGNGSYSDDGFCLTSGVNKLYMTSILMMIKLLL